MSEKRTAQDEIALLESQAREIERLISYRALEQYEPYPKQLIFHSAGALPGISERLLMAGNQLGKTLSASREVAMHATGLYPAWWAGVVFDKPTAGWAASETSQGTRDTVQRMLLGPPGVTDALGTGAIPKDSIIEVKKATHGVADAIETIVVKHYPPRDNPRKLSDGSSRIVLKTYDQGRERWQGDSLQYIWNDEEPPLDIYMEGLTRTNATGGVSFTTFTPLKGMSEVVMRFLTEKAPGTHVTHMTIADALHYTEEERRRIIARYKPHERKARTEGLPMLGEGQVFPFEEEILKEPPIQLPAWWPRLAGIDFGFDHPTAVVWVAWDKDTDTVHVYDCYKRREATPVVHAAVIRAKGAWIPVAWPHDGGTRDSRTSGTTLAQQYRDLGANMLTEKATHPPAKGQKEGEGGISLEASITDVYDRMQTGRLKIAKHLEDLFGELRLYHRKNGLVVPENDDLISALFKACMMLRKAAVRQPPPRPKVVTWRPTVQGLGALG